MRKSLIITSVIVLCSIALYGVYSSFFKRTPEKVLKQMFNISLDDFDYHVELFEEQWCPNGDGSALIIYKFDKLTQGNIDYLKSFGMKPMPISEENLRLMTFNKIPPKYLYSNKGYYLYKLLNNNDSLDYQVFLFDLNNKTAVLYLQYM